MSAAVTVDDLQRLPAAVQHRDTTVFADQDLLDRLEVFVATAIDVREAQRTRSGTSHHQRLMESYRAARVKWIQDRETYASDYPAEKAEFEQLHPRPRLKDFMRAHRCADRLPEVATDGACPVCGAPLKIISRAAA